MAPSGKIDFDPVEHAFSGADEDASAGRVIARAELHSWTAPRSAPVRMPPAVNTWASPPFGTAGVQQWLRDKYEESLADLAEIEERMQTVIEKQQVDDRRSAFMALLVQARGAWRQLEHVRSLVEQTAGDTVKDRPSSPSWPAWRAEVFRRMELEEMRRAA